MVNCADAVRVSVPLVPVTVSVTVPPLLSGRPTVSEAVPGGAGLGEKPHPAPAGKPLQDKLTGELKPPIALIVTVYSAEPPTAVCDAGEIASLKSGVAVTFNVALALALEAPLLPTTVKFTLPIGVLPVVMAVSVEVPGGAGFGEKLHAAPAGNPMQASVTGELKPVPATTETV